MHLILVLYFAKRGSVLSSPLLFSYVCIEFCGKGILLYELSPHGCLWEEATVV